MPVRSADIVDLLPDLRRYATALVGEPARADRLVELCLERLLADQSQLSGRHLRLTLLALFDRIHDEALVAEPAGQILAGTLDGLNRSVHELPLDERKALLLVTLVRLSHGDAAAVLGATSELVARRVLSARERLRHALSRRVLVIEDEPMMAMSIAHIMTRMGHEVCGVAHTRREALARVRDARPTLIVADVRLRDGDNGIATVREIVRQRSVPVIFVTGYVREVMADDQLWPATVVGKPFAARTLEQAVRRVLDANEMLG